MLCTTLRYKLDCINDKHPGCEIIRIYYGKKLHITVNHFDKITYIYDINTGSLLNIKYASLQWNKKNYAPMDVSTLLIK